MALIHGKPNSILDDAYSQVDAMYKSMMNNQAAQAQSMAPFTYSDLKAMQQAAVNNTVPSLDHIALDLLKRRMAGVTGTFRLNRDEFLTCYVSSGTVYVFFVLNGKAGHFVEEVTIFPSDKMLTQIRMIR